MSDSDSDINNDDMDIGGADNVPNVPAANNNDEDNNNDNSTTNEENYTQSEIEEKNNAIDKFLRAYKQYETYQTILSKLEEPSDSCDERRKFMKYARTLLSCEENGATMDGTLDNLPMDMTTLEEMSNTLASSDEMDPSPDDSQKKLDSTTNPSSNSPEIKMATTEADASTIPLKKLKEVLFRPGMKFRGEIVVPGMGSNSSPFVNDDPEEENELEDSNSTQPNMRRSDNNPTISNESGRASSSTDESNEGGETGKLYELVVFYTGADPLGNYQICASHAAYGDEQCVRIQTSTEEVEGSDKKRLKVEYSDGETSCSGYWNEKKFRLEGNVRQRLQANDGIFHTSEVTHVFTLYPCLGRFPAGREEEEISVASDNTSLSLCEDLLSRDTAAIAAHRNRTYNTLRYSLQEFIVSVQIQPRMSTIDMHELREAFRSLRLLDDAYIESQLNETQKVLWKLRFVKFDELLTRTTKVAGEDTCAKFRSRAALLDSFHFNTIQDRDEFITEWKEKKIDLQEAHRHWDMVNFLMKSIAQMVFVFEPGSLNNTSPIHRRLEVSYECFESAYRRAEKRLTKEELTQYEINTDQQHQEGLKSVDCIICQMPLLDEGEEDMSCLYKLPCSHYFHKKCVEQWLHNNSTCPACRLDLTDSLDPRIYSRQRELQPWELSIQASREAFDEEEYLQRGGYE